MSGVHDMGGVHGFGHMEPEENEPVFHEEWEGRMFGLMVSTGRDYFSRGAIESIEPATYLSSSYYEKWLMALEKVMVAKGVLSPDELEGRTGYFASNPEAVPSKKEDPKLAERVRPGMYRQRRPRREARGTSKFKPGDTVRARDIETMGHTRLPDYVRRRRGVVDRVYGVYDFPDAVHGSDGVPPQYVYNVRFLASELWRESAEPGGSLHIDMWESYLEPAGRLEGVS